MQVKYTQLVSQHMSNYSLRLWDKMQLWDSFHVAKQLGYFTYVEQHIL